MQRNCNSNGCHLELLKENPFNRSLKSHEISFLSKFTGHKIFESYIENNTSGAKRLFWHYGNANEIIIDNYSNHPNKTNKKDYIKAFTTKNEEYLDDIDN